MGEERISTQWKTISTLEEKTSILEQMALEETAPVLDKITQTEENLVGNMTPWEERISTMEKKTLALDIAALEETLRLDSPALEENVRFLEEKAAALEETVRIFNC